MPEKSRRYLWIEIISNQIAKEIVRKIKRTTAKLNGGLCKQGFFGKIRTDLRTSIPLSSYQTVAESSTDFSLEPNRKRLNLVRSFRFIPPSS